MLRFFRILRKKLLEEGNIRKYFWYALGEILLVMIGILLALQVNNWNSERQLSESAEINLELLAKDLTEDRESLLALIEIYENDLNNALLTLNMIKGVIDVSDRVSEYLVEFQLEYNFYPRNSALNVLLNSGEISVLDVELQNMISQYYRAVDAVKERDEISNIFIRDKYELHIFEEYSSLYTKGNTFPDIEEFYQDDTRDILIFDTEKFLADKKLEALLFARFYQIKTLINVYNSALESLSDLQKSIE